MFQRSLSCTFTCNEAPPCPPPPPPGGIKMRIGPPYPQRVLKGDYLGRLLGISVKRVALCRCLDGHVKAPYEMSMALGA